MSKIKRRTLALPQCRPIPLCFQLWESQWPIGLANLALRGPFPWERRDM